MRSKLGPAGEHVTNGTVEHAYIYRWSLGHVKETALHFLLLTKESISLVASVRRQLFSREACLAVCERLFFCKLYGKPPQNGAF
jgi:hypothetical protein